MRRPEKLQAALLLFGLVLLWVAAQAELARLSGLGVILLGLGAAAGGFFRLQAAWEWRSIPEAPAVPRQVVMWTRGLVQTGLGLALAMGGLTASLVGWERAWRLITRHPAPALLAVGSLLLAQAVILALAGGEPMSSRRQSLVSLPVRLASLPTLLLGLLILGVGGYALLAPAQFRAWLEVTFGAFPGP